jgi:Ice-binding-like/Bacterial Ig-like domain
MSPTKSGPLCFFLVALFACGDQLVEFPLDPSAGGSAPTITMTSPAPSAINNSVTRRVTATFSRAMNPATLTSTTFLVRQGVVPVAGVVTYGAGMATFTPASPLMLSREYTATITTTAADPQGNGLAVDHVWTFSTGACSQTGVALRSAGEFAVLAGSTVTNTGPTAVTGDLGISPGTSMTGFPPGTITGSFHMGDATSAQSLVDLTTAYNDAAGRSLCPTSVAGNLGGQTLAAGLYKSTSALEISAGDLTLDAQGDEDAVFIFQIASTLTTTAARKVILAGGANAANIYWQVGSSATLGTTSSFAGTIMANQAITVGTGASHLGRLLARIAGVTLDSNPIVKPAP